jgi:hypothetical protein
MYRTKNDQISNFSWRKWNARSEKYIIRSSTQSYKLAMSNVYRVTFVDRVRHSFAESFVCILKAQSRSHSKEWRFNLSFPWVSMLFLNIWRVSVVPYNVTTHLPAIQNQHWQSREAQIEPPLFEWAFRIPAIILVWISLWPCIRAWFTNLWLTVLIFHITRYPLIFRENTFNIPCQLSVWKAGGGFWFQQGRTGLKTITKGKAID